MQFLRIVLFCELAAIVYGLAHDQITAHISPEYFIIAHPKVMESTDPFRLALWWGFNSTWWIGLAFGLFAAATARIGAHGKLTASDIAPMVYKLLGIMAVGALFVGSLASYLVSIGQIPGPLGYQNLVPPERWTAFSGVAWAHLTSYAVGIPGSLILIFLIAWRRIKGRAQSNA